MSKEILETANQRADQVKEQGETRLFSLETQEANEKPMILVGARDMGTARNLEPVIVELRKRGYGVSVLTDNPSEKFLRTRFPDAKEISLKTSLEAIDVTKPSLVLSGISATNNPGIEFYLAKTGESESESEKIPVVWVEDLWGVATRKEQFKFAIHPDVVCAYDEYSKNLDMEHIQQAGKKDWSRVKFEVTGSPVMDELAGESNHQKISDKVRVALGVEKEDVMVTYMGGGPPEDLVDLKKFITGLEKVAEKGDKKIKFTARIHPSIFGTGSLAKYKKEFEILLEGLKGENIEVVDTMGLFSTDEVAIATDVIVSRFSTEGVKGVYRNKVCLFMLLPELGGKALKESDGMDTLPVIETGASLGVFKEKDLVAVIGKALDPAEQEKLFQAQRRHHHLDGRNTERVVEIIENILKKKGYEK